MKPHQLAHGRKTTIRLVADASKPFPHGLQKHAEVRLVFDRDNVSVLWDQQTFLVKGHGIQDTDSLQLLGRHNLPGITHVVARHKDDLTVVNHGFPTQILWEHPLEIGVDDKIVEDVRNRHKQMWDSDRVARWLAQELLVEPTVADGLPRVIVSGTPLTRDNAKLAFRLHGHGYAADVAQVDNDSLQITRIVESRRRVEISDRRALYLLSAQIGFCDVTLAGKFRGQAKEELDALVRSGNSYLSLWETYQNKEKEWVDQRALQLGWLGYKSCCEASDGTWTFSLTGDPEKIELFFQRLDEEKDTVELVATETVPPLLLGNTDEGSAKAKKQPFVGEVVNLGPSTFEIRLRPQPKDREEPIPPEKGMLSLATGGDQVRLERRQTAWARVRETNNRMPTLGMLLEGQQIPTRRLPTIHPLSKAVKDILKNPTDQQTEALRVALNTPDIALIQGPPGTGKTQVIAALQARLSDSDLEMDSTHINGSVLLTSFQHDAVENAAAKTRVLGLPAVKVGTRRGGENNAIVVSQWRHETAEAARAARAVDPAVETVHTALREVTHITAGYFKIPTKPEQLPRLLTRVLDTASAYLPQSTIHRILEVRQSIDNFGRPKAPTSEQEFLLRAVRTIRDEAGPFSDDGPEKAYKLLERLKQSPGIVLRHEWERTLQTAAAWEGDTPNETLFIALAQVKNALIDMLTPCAVAENPQPLFADVESVFNQVLEQLSEKAKNTKTGIGDVIREWVETLENEPHTIQDAVDYYTMVFAATCQQAVSKHMTRVKGDNTFVFRTVIVDEAARANPLDLMIPMSLAERRIVLVGDHRQLPHLLEPNVEKEIERSLNEEHREALHNSLFEKLFLELKAREQKDGIKRTATLDRQFRMHPVLGQFVSEQFYKPYGEEFGAGFTADRFTHNICLNHTSLKDKVAVWITADAKLGWERSGASKTRPVEAKIAADNARQLLEQNPGISVGVITFYAAQRDLIWKELVKSGLAEHSEIGFVPKSNYRLTPDGKERLRVGTVDAFQGKEFDVVILSTVRCSDTVVKDEASRRRKYGFLMLENRLCVAMSRQKKLLIVIGDPALGQREEAQQTVPSLAGFYALCRSKDGCVITP